MSRSIHDYLRDNAPAHVLEWYDGLMGYQIDDLETFLVDEWGAKTVCKECDEDSATLCEKCAVTQCETCNDRPAVFCITCRVEED